MSVFIRGNATMKSGHFEPNWSLCQEEIVLIISHQNHNVLIRSNTWYGNQITYIPPVPAFWPEATSILSCHLFFPNHESEQFLLKGPTAAIV